MWITATVDVTKQDPGPERGPLIQTEIVTVVWPVVTSASRLHAPSWLHFQVVKSKWFKWKINCVGASPCLYPVFYSVVPIKCHIEANRSIYVMVPLGSGLMAHTQNSFSVGRLKPSALKFSIWLLVNLKLHVLNILIILKVIYILLTCKAFSSKGRCLFRILCRGRACEEGSVASIKMDE